MKLIKSACWAALALAASLSAQGAQVWTEGVNYFLVQPARTPSVPAGKIEVTEVFSYACPACNIFQPTMHKLKQSMPANVVVDYLPAAFNTCDKEPLTDHRGRRQILQPTHFRTGRQVHCDVEILFCGS